MHLWFWSWVILALVCLVSEAVTGGYLVIPWALGAGTAALLDALGAAIGWQWIAFVGVSSVLLVAGQRLIVQRRANPRE